MTRIMYRATLMLISLTYLHSNTLHTQSNFNIYPKIGSACPDFTLTGLTHSKNKKASLVDFKGKWLVLDFWTRSCSSCISSFPKMNALQKEFKSSIEFVLVGNNEQRYNKGIEQLYRGISKRHDLKLTAAFDSVLFKRFGVSSTPHLIVIDPNGIVRAITYPSELNSNSLNAFLSGIDPGLLVKANKMEQRAKEVKRVDPFVLFRKQYVDGQISSVLSKWSSDNPIYNNDKIREGDSVYYATAISLRKLYNVAFLGKTDWGMNDSLYGKQWHVPLLELKDSILFSNSLLKEYGLFNYGLILPKGKTDLKSVQKAMQQDLERSFGYKVSFENRNMPCLFLMLNRNKRNSLITKGGKPANFLNRLSMSVKNTSVNVLIQRLLDARGAGYPIVDRTNLGSNIDLSLHADMGNFSDIVKELERKGLYLVEGTYEMNVIVLKD